MANYDFSKYHALRRKGLTPAEVYHQAVADGVDEISCIRLLREVFNLTLVDAKRVIVGASDRAESLEDHQENLFPSLKRALQDLDDKN